MTTYNGYPSREAFHEALQSRMNDYAAARDEGMRTNPEGWRHADCDHASGICSDGPEPDYEALTERDPEARIQSDEVMYEQYLDRISGAG